jgi:hypothetical protein
MFTAKDIIDMKNSGISIADIATLQGSGVSAAEQSSAPAATMEYIGGASAPAKTAKAVEQFTGPKGTLECDICIANGTSVCEGVPQAVGHGKNVTKAQKKQGYTYPCRCTDVSEGHNRQFVNLTEGQGHLKVHKDRGPSAKQQKFFVEYFVKANPALQIGWDEGLQLVVPTGTTTAKPAAKAAAKKPSAAAKADAKSREEIIAAGCSYVMTNGNVCGRPVEAILDGLSGYCSTPGGTKWNHAESAEAEANTAKLIQGGEAADTPPVGNAVSGVLEADLDG